MQSDRAGFLSSHELRESKNAGLPSTDSHLVLSNNIICSYLDATNEFSDIPMIEGALQINDTKVAHHRNEALLRWKDISNKVEVRVFSIKTLVRGFPDISVIPEVKSSFFGATKLFFFLEAKNSFANMAFEILILILRFEKVCRIVSKANNFCHWAGNSSALCNRSIRCPF
jgi:hypothetical protein